MSVVENEYFGFMSKRLNRLCGGDFTVLDELANFEGGYLTMCNQRWSPLLAVASRLNLLELTNELLKRGAEVNQRYEDRNPVTKFLVARMSAVMEAKSSTVLKELITAGADLQARSSDGQSVFTHLAWRNDPEMLSLFADHSVPERKEVEYFIYDNAHKITYDEKFGGTISKHALAVKAKLQAMKLVLARCEELAI
jgi:hypothetical protein